MNTYYSESIERDARVREEYLNGIQDFLEKKRQKARTQRKSFISPNQYQANPEKYRQKLKEMLGFPLQEEQEIPTLAQKILVAQDKNVKIYRMQFVFWNTVKFYGLYFEQTKYAEKSPFILAFHGGGGTPELCSSFHKDSANYHHLVRRLTDRGANVFAPQLLLWEPAIYGTEFNRHNIDGKLRQLGGSITALELYFLRGSLDYFIREESIAKTKIGVAGLSYGGMYALHLAAIEPRIKACYSCSWVNDSFTHSWPDWSYFNAQNLFTSVETAALVAPRALVVAMGDHDCLFSDKLTVEQCEQIKLYFKQLRCPEQFLSIIFDGDHELDVGPAEMDFLFDKLK